MKMAVISFSLTGAAAAERLIKRLRENRKEETLEVETAVKSRYCTEGLKEPLDAWTRRQFEKADLLIFVGACGIAVRSIAPYVKSKKTDPAVLVIDECGKFVISLLSGHLGGANEYAKEAARALGAVPVVTTATDLHGVFAVDTFAKKNGCSIHNMTAAKEVSAALLAGEDVGLYSDFPIQGGLPLGLKLCDSQGRDEKGEVISPGICISLEKEKHPFSHTVNLIPRIVTAGVGCRRECPYEKIRQALFRALQEARVCEEALEKIASITLKEKEPGILALAGELSVPFAVYSAGELKEAEGNFQPSSFVREVTGVDNVCERSAVTGSGGGTLIQEKLKADGATAALAVRDWSVRFE